MLNTAHLLQPTTFPAIERGELKTLQVNLGLRCNLSCQHCHVNAGPQRTEQMERGVVEDVLRFLSRQQLQSLDLTGGAPELNPNFRYLVEKARAMGVHVIDRCNLTVLEESGQEGVAEFLAANRVEVVASLPCYLQENVDSQRGKGSYDASIRGLKQLNQLGYGDPASGLSLNLVYNPLGPSLPPPQGPLEADYRKQLAERFGISFNQLFTITNMPIRRFGSLLHSKGEFHTYLDLLRSSFSPDNLQELMCRSLISVDWQGRVYDCDFNQMLDMPISDENSPRPTLSTLLDTDLRGRPIQIAEHCYGCTAGQGSSCGGALD
ncbi:Fe-S oxidoreductase [Candidatus Endoriftia persephone str. Guaymas]|nr:Fe-S oxidoreductase [Candidatus Endoriftia persephone str. Guaymas]